MNKAESVDAFSRIEGDTDAPKGSRDYPQAEYNRIGKIIARQIKQIPQWLPSARIYAKEVMPDHIHFVIDIRDRLPWHLGKYISKFRHFVRERLGYDPFLPGYNDKIIYAERSLDDVIQYVKDNPYRLAVRRAKRSFFDRCDRIRLNGEYYIGYGNLQLLKNPFIEAVIIHRRYSPEQREDLRDRWLDASYGGTVMVSPFISPAEKEIRKQIEQIGGPVILIVDKPLPDPPYKPARHDFEQCAKGELLILAPRDEDWSKGRATVSREACKRMNALAEYIANRSLS